MEAILGYEAAEFEQRTVGDKIFIPKINKVLKVIGILERVGTQDDGIVFIPLKTTQNLFGLDNKLTGIGIKLKDISQLSVFEEDLYHEPGIQVISMAQVRGTIYNLISSAKVMTSSVAVIAIIVAIIGVINTILMSVLERTKEIGILKAIGASSFNIFQLIWFETTLICALGGVVGNIFALIGSGIIEFILKGALPYAPAGKLVFLEPSLVISSIVLAVIVGLITGIYPALRASRLRPVEAIRIGE